jgi:glutamate-1-semialdehyde 2,1-aminomutase
LLENGLRKNLQNTGIKGIINRIGSLMTLFFTDEGKVNSYKTAVKSDTAKYARYFNLSLEKGIYMAPSQFEAAFVSFAHTDSDIERTVRASLTAMQNLKTD